MTLLRSVPVGRIVYTDQALPAIRPVTFVMDGDEAVVIRTAPGSKLDAALRDAIVAFEVDDLNSAAGTGWAVTVIGPALAVTSAPEIRRLESLPLVPWLPGAHQEFLRISCARLSGWRYAGRPVALAPQ
ncbi:pyridoxamine 5'-phosphate oxidase family protein [Actinomadura macra]|uniref:pyridoxamine 5'-phosphate oxidase family protein n=1 Tax=Actinomadura macra TaxID=46164 RepID=UPI000A935777|nr:pyridoxamine 5'-phosphate oxidase family protein [Actinomadura macra]